MRARAASRSASNCMGAGLQVERMSAARGVPEACRRAVRFPLVQARASSDNPAMRLHDYDASGNCYKVRLLLALTGTAYERVPVDIFAGDTLGDDFARLNPVRETPVLELDDGSVVAQSN